jgi:signal transduction histidine kinase
VFPGSATFCRKQLQRSTGQDARKQKNDGQEYTIESVVETVRSAIESLAQNKKLLLTTEVTKPLPLGFGDEQRLIQVLLNLVGQVHRHGRGAGDSQIRDRPLCRQRDGHRPWHSR